MIFNTLKISNSLNRQIFNKLSGFYKNESSQMLQFPLKNSDQSNLVLGGSLMQRYSIFYKEYNSSSLLGILIRPNNKK